jgi:hypothetical protein
VLRNAVHHQEQMRKRFPQDWMDPFSSCFYFWITIQNEKERGGQGSQGGQGGPSPPNRSSRTARAGPPEESRQRGRSKPAGRSGLPKQAKPPKRSGTSDRAGTAGTAGTSERPSRTGQSGPMGPLGQIPLPKQAPPGWGKGRVPEWFGDFMRLRTGLPSSEIVTAQTWLLLEGWRRGRGRRRIW